MLFTQADRQSPSPTLWAPNSKLAQLHENKSHMAGRLAGEVAFQHGRERVHQRQNPLVLELWRQEVCLFPEKGFPAGEQVQARQLVAKRLGNLERVPSVSFLTQTALSPQDFRHGPKWMGCDLNDALLQLDHLTFGTQCTARTTTTTCCSVSRLP